MRCRLAGQNINASFLSELFEDREFATHYREFLCKIGFM